jgi:hypothetical protein
MIHKRAALIPKPRALSINEAMCDTSWFWNVDLTLGIVTKQQKEGMDLWDKHMRHSEELQLLTQETHNFKLAITASMSLLKSIVVPSVDSPYSEALAKFRDLKVQELSSWIRDAPLDVDVDIESEDDEGFCLEDLLDEVDKIKETQ